ncbi:MAG TPA: DUF5698 domain-containing protein [Ignavibacteriaceae bacterium]|nr:DUF5698 domain-containing protein [Ignavibacteriaceae bacterium]
MFESVYGAFIIMGMRICDVTLGTLRTILVVQGRKYYAAMIGFVEVLIWVFVIRFVVQNLDHIPNLIGYAAGFATGNILGITIEQKIGLGFVQLNIISRHLTDKIADKLRKLKYGLTILPGEGGSGGVAIIVTIIPRKYQKKAISIIEEIDKSAFITVQHSLPYRGFIHGSRK